jgi:hypothetical protein
MAKLILSKCLTIFTVLGLSFATLVVASGNAGASSSYREGQDGNNLVCGGVHTLAKAIYIARGGSVKCANGTVERGIGKIWAAEGMTLQVIERMKVGTVCSNQGYLSSGREIGPDPSKNVRHEVAGMTVYSRPYSVWGYECAQWLHGFTENGESVGILTGCGNGLMRYWPPSGPSPVRTVACVLNGTPETSVPVGYTVQNGNCVSIAAQACVVNYGGQWNSVTGICGVTQGNCNTFIVLNGNGNEVNVTYNNSCDTTTSSPPPTTTTTTSTTTTTTLPKPPPTTTTTMPTPSQPPQVSGLGVPENMQIDSSRPMCGDITAPVGDSLSVTFSSGGIGLFFSPIVTATGAGVATKVCDTYSAPTNPIDAGQYDTYSVIAYDSTSRLYSAVQTSDSFEIINLVPTP